MTVTFCGHSALQPTDSIRIWLKSAITQAIINGADRFFLSDGSAFDRMAAEILWELKAQYPHVRSIVVTPYLNHRIDITCYDGTEYPAIANQSGFQKTYSCSKWKIDNSDIVISCVTHFWGDAAATLRYAMRKRKQIWRYTEKATHKKQGH